MAGPYAGKAASFYTYRGTSTALTDQPMSFVSGTTYMVTTRTHAWWDPNATVVVKDNTSAITTGYSVNYAGGYVTLAQAPVGTVTASFSYFTMERLGGGYGWSVKVKGGTAETTEFPIIGATTPNKSYIGTLKEWTANVKRHWYYAKAAVDMNCDSPVANTKSTWTWKKTGSFGNLEAVKYVAGVGALSVARVGHLTTVTIATGGSTMNAIIAYVANDATLSTMWDVTNFTGHDGSGTVTAAAQATCTGGRDSGEQIADLATKVLGVFYLSAASSTGERLEGVGVIDGITYNTPIEKIVEADLTFQGTGPMDYHSA